MLKSIFQIVLALVSLYVEWILSLVMCLDIGQMVMLHSRSAGAVALAMLLMLVYVTIRFEFKLAMGAVLSTQRPFLFVA